MAIISASTLAKKAQWIARKRAEARTAGVCTRCCKQRPDSGHKVCRFCEASVSQYRRRRRKLALQRKELQQVIIAHERAGDIATEHHLYEDAAQHYQYAMESPVITQNDRLRIMEKLAYAVLLSGDIEAADALFSRLISEYGDAAREPGKIIEMIWQKARVAVLPEALSLLSQAIKLAEIAGNQRLLKLTHSRMADCLMGLNRYDEALSYVETAGERGDAGDTPTRIAYYLQKAMLAGAFGKSEEAFETFEHVVQMAKETPDVLNILRVWDSYGAWAQILGNITLSKTCAENALLVVRKYHLTAYIPYSCLVYVRYLSCAGQYETAHRYLLEALSYETQEDRIAIGLARYGIPIALYVKNEATLAKCARPSTIDAAFRTGVPNIITDVAAAFAQWHAACGRERDAQKLLHRVTEVVRVRIDGVWRFPIIAAQHGKLSDFPQVRKMLEKTDAALLHSDLTRACLLLFDAFVARRKGQHSESREYARAAAELFTTLGWYEYVDIAHELLPSRTVVVPDAAKEYTAFTHLLSVLSIRERQVVELVLKGHTNRAIGEALSIAERTVESHMTSIMSHLGVRSRHQLRDVTEESVP